MDPPAPIPEHPQSQTEIPHLDSDPDCPFCTIIATYPPISPLYAPGNKSLDPYKLDPPAYVLLSTEHVVAFLDVYPLVRGHVLICPRRHGVKVGDLRAEEGAELGRIIPLLSRALIHATQPDIPHSSADYNIVQNNGPGAAQVIPHTHFHFVPRYPFDYVPVVPHPVMQEGRNGGDGKIRFSSGRRYESIKRPEGMEATRILFGRGQRHYRDEEESEELVEVMRRCVGVEWEREFGKENGKESVEGGGVSREDRTGKERGRGGGGRL